MKSSNETVDVIIPTKPNCEFLIEAIHSVLNQSFEKYNLWVVINAKSWMLERKLKRLGINSLVELRVGAGWARWHGVQHTNSEYIFFLDSDDILLPNALEECLGTINSNIDVVYGGIQNFVQEPSRKFEFSNHYPIRFTPLASNSLITRRVIQQFPFTDFSNTSWVKWISTARLNGVRFKSTDNLITRRRIHNRNISRAHDTRTDVVKFVLDHHRNRFFHES